MGICRGQYTCKSYREGVPQMQRYRVAIHAVRIFFVILFKLPMLLKVTLYPCSIKEQSDVFGCSNGTLVVLFLCAITGRLSWVRRALFLSPLETHTPCTNSTSLKILHIFNKFSGLLIRKSKVSRWVTCCTSIVLAWGSQNRLASSLRLTSVWHTT